MTAFKRSLHRPLNRRRLAVAGAVAAGALLLAACGDGDSASSPASSTQATAPVSAGAFNDADVTFAQGMIPHHQQALEMAGLADGRAEDQEIKTLAGQIEKAQDPEITTLRSWLTAWGKPESPAAGHGGGHGGMPGMMSEQEMKDLTAAKGKDFDRKFAQLMVAHHNGAVEMAKTELKDGSNADAKKLADAIIKAQSAEITQLQSILNRL
ncbi:DUF305 domain-containing protein [Streptomyces erythrochromogenes]|uniref:DUF305 domain-containing protein n=1 Tax=Streptomyces erythrochromogenes TaxID=285574 RepID=UPI0022551A6E|nr:DUF305 domain-containing protein [Streptomyces erythrochromogenes]MCX5582949.1 DUF305 domain-containing protein [Streptomyces erythrochromogenes]